MLKNKRILVGYWLILFLFTRCYAGQEFKYDSKGKRNPFIPLVTDDGRLLKFEEEEGVSKNLWLEGIIYDKYGLSWACVNGEIVKIGDKIGAYQVLKIEEDKVVFIKDGELLKVELKKEE